MRTRVKTKHLKSKRDRGMRTEENKLKNLGIQLPIFPLTSVGSFPKFDYIKKGRSCFEKGEIGANDLLTLEKKATEEWIQFQEEIGIDILVDGEMYRGDMVAYFAEKLPGFKEGGFVRSYGNRFYKKPVISEAVGWEKPLTVDWWKFAQSLTRKPVKGMLTGPYTIMDWSFNEHYKDREAAALALAKVIRKEVEALIDAGAKIIQVDEPACSVRPKELPLVVRTMDIVTRDLPAYFVTHICYGDFEKIYPEMNEIPVDNYDLEMSNSENDLLNCFRKVHMPKDLSAGIVDVHTHQIEEHALLMKRLRDILEVVSPSQLWVDPDCGLKTRTVDEAKEKLKAVVKAVKALRAQSS